MVLLISVIVIAGRLIARQLEVLICHGAYADEVVQASSHNIFRRLRRPNVRLRDIQQLFRFDELRVPAPSGNKVLSIIFQGPVPEVGKLNFGAAAT